jgi:hypothetical protein
MRRIALSLILLTTVVVAEAAAQTQTFNFTNFDEVQVRSGMRVSIKQGGTYQVTATGSSEDLARLQARHTGKRVEFEMPSDFLSWFRSGRISLDITMPALRRLSLSGGSEGDIPIMQIGAEPFRADLSGGSRLNGEIRSGDMDLHLSGGSRATLSGSGQRLSVSGSGGSKFELSDLAVTDVRGSLSGGSDVTYHQNANLGNISTSGGSQARRGRR